MLVPKNSQRVLASSARALALRFLGGVKDRWEGWVPWELAVRKGLQNSLHFFFHASSYEQPKHLRHFYPPLPTPEDIESAIEGILEKYWVISTEEYVDRVKRGKLRERQVLATITCDDGLREFKTYLWPIMNKYSIPCTLFLVKNFVEQKEYFYRFKTSLVLNAILEQPEAAERARECLKRHGKNCRQEIETKLGLKKAILKIHRPEDHFLLDMLTQDLDIQIEQYYRATKPFLDRDEVIELNNQGVRIGSHGVRHHRYELLSSENIMEDILDGLAYVQELSGQSTVEHAFPFNAENVSRNLLYKVLSNQSALTHFFDSGGIRRDAPFVTHRITLDVDPRRALRYAAYEFLAPAIPFSAGFH